MVADWHVKGRDKTWVLTQLGVLAARQRHIEDKIRDAIYRQRFSQDENEIRRALEEERHHLKALDGVMTSIRALEGKLMLLPLDS